VIKFETVRDCLQCHIASEITSAKIKNDTITITGSGFNEVIDSNTVYVDKSDGTSTCATPVLQWMDDTIVTESACATVGDTVVVPCAIAEALLTGCTPTSNREKGKTCWDFIDNDCDGATDCADTRCDGEIGPPIACGFGVCASTGNLTCSGGTQVDTCTPGNPTEPGMEVTCDDGFDNDCDGLTDTEDPDCQGCSIYQDRDSCRAAGCRWKKGECVNP
jgi:hypothetical protein